jgi:hypothetical protein
MSTKRKIGSAPGNQSKGVKGVDAAAYIRLGEMIGILLGQEIPLDRFDHIMSNIVMLTNDAIAHGAPGPALNMIDGVTRGLDESKKR